MLAELYVENFALIEKLSLPLDGGLCALSGETGAGKSLLLDAISLLCGGRADSTLVRDGEEKCAVFGVFTAPFSEEIGVKLAENGLDKNEDLVISREHNKNGRGSCRINGKPFNLSVLKELGRLLINIHGQHEQTLLLDEGYQLDLLDRFGGEELLASKKQAANAWHNLQDSRKQLREYEKNNENKDKQLDYLNFVSNEIAALNLRVGEDSELEEERNRLANAESLLEQVAAASAALNLNGRGRDSIAEALSALRQAAAMDEATFGELNERLNDIYYNLEDIAVDLARSERIISVDPHRLDEVENRLQAINRVKKKYGGSIEAVLNEWEKTDLAIRSLTDSEYSAEVLMKQITEQENLYNKAAKNLSEHRKEAAASLAQAVTGELHSLSMTDAEFSVSLPKVNEGSEGKEKAVYLFTANRGEKPRPLAKIASGGELARIILAIKVILARIDFVPTLIFDEVDSGMGGYSLSAVAEKMHEVGKSAQTLCVTHSPIMASRADRHIRIYKKEENGRTRIYCKVLSYDERIDELSRMLAGSKSNEVTIAQAKELLTNI
ncbi:MAG: DNA repair protein RecN [Clostridia bacterium]|nr:DNA repair protein RecN [Clostridia bacterium]MDD4798209.1 DNA repair protein RecN [Clostridia bacterium]